jgi:hypothetical protein
MSNWNIGSCLLFWVFLCSQGIGQTNLAARELIQRADPLAKIEYCGAVSTGGLDYFLFILEQKELAGMALVREQNGTAPVIVDADTSLFPFQNDIGHSVRKPVQDAIELLLRKRNRAKQRSGQKSAGSSDPEISAVGRQIDRVIYPISGFRLDSNSTREILRLLRIGPAMAVDPGKAPPGSIIVSPSQSSPYGPIYLGNAGIVGLGGSIYSADARYGGARSRNFSLTSWRQQFSGKNGWYAFVLRSPAGKKEH